MKNILLAVIIDENTQFLINKATDLAEKFGSKIWIIHIASPDPDYIGYEIGPQYVRDYRAEELRKEHKKINEYVKELKKKGISAEGLMIQGSTTEMILDVSVKLHTDLIILGHHKHNLWYDIFIGSLYSDIVKESKVPVLVVPFEE